MTGFHERAKMRENISHGCKAMRGKAPGRVACLEFAEGEKRTAITTDRAVEEIHIFLKIICRKQDSMWQNLIIVIADEVSAMIDHAMKEIPAAALLYYYI